MAPVAPTAPGPRSVLMLGQAGRTVNPGRARRALRPGRPASARTGRARGTLWTDWTSHALHALLILDDQLLSRARAGSRVHDPDGAEGLVHARIDRVSATRLNVYVSRLAQHHCREERTIPSEAL